MWSSPEKGFQRTKWTKLPLKQVYGSRGAWQLYGIEEEILNLPRQDGSVTEPFHKSKEKLSSSVKFVEKDSSVLSSRAEGSWLVSTCSSLSAKSLCSAVASCPS